MQLLLKGFEPNGTLRHQPPQRADPVANHAPNLTRQFITSSINPRR
jgi:hypothetical protein